MTLTTEQQNSISIVRISGRIDALTSPSFESQIFSFVDAGATCILLNFSQCDFINSNGLRILLMLRKRLLGQGSIAVCGLQGSISAVFEIAGFTSLFHLRATEDEALEALSAAHGSTSAS